MNGYMERVALVIETNKPVIKGLEPILRNSQYQIIQTSSFDEGMSFLTDNPVDLIFMNSKISGINGKQFLKALQRQKRASGIPFLMLDTINEDDKYNLLLNLRADAIFSKKQSLRFVKEKIKQFSDINDDRHNPLYEYLEDIIGVTEQADSLKDFLDQANYYSRKMTSSDRSSIYLIEGTKLVAQIADGISEPTGIRLDVGQGIAGMCVEMMLPIIVNDVANHHRFFNNIDRDSGYETKRTLVVPIIFKGQLLGVVQVINKKNPYVVNDRHALEYFSKFLAQQILSFQNTGKREEELHWRQNIFNAMNDGFVVCSGEGKIIQANLAILKLYNGVEEDLLGLQLETILSNDEAQTENIKNVGMFTTKDGQIIPVNVKSRSVGNEANSSYKIYYIKDIRDQIFVKKEEKPQTIMDSDFISMIVHDIKNPLTNIIAAANFLQSALEEKGMMDLYSFAEQIDRNAFRTTNLVNDILDLSKFEFGKLTIHPLNYDVVENLTNVAKDLQYFASLKQVSIVIINNSFFDTMQGDKKYLNRVWSNLIANAIKFSPKNSKIRVSVTAIRNEDRQYCSVQIEDEGPGVPEYLMEKIFNKYVQVEANDSGQKASGTGLGLNIAKVFVECHQGRIFAENLDNGGALFTVLLPMSGVVSNG